ncbi:MAG: BspA family leucine-rich repeat surface protein, partial [Lachnospiraceae bacterium]|nr:BspA family leucine-rich repeat surface protein [Lachnospiraceae bacterium]
AGFVATQSISYDCYYYGGDDNYTKYWSDEPYYASKMGSFSLRPYVYRFTDTGTEHILTLYHVTPYSLFVRKIEQGMHVFDNWKAADYSQANLPIDTWKIPATYTDPLSGTTYNVRIAKGGNIVPQFASKLIVEDGVGFPEDCSYLFSSMGNITLRCLSEIVIQGNPKTVGSNIKNMSYMFLGKKGREGFDATTYDSLDFAALDTSNVTDMSFMFADVTMTNRANIGVTTLDTSKVTNFKGMFRSYHVPSGLYQPATALDLSHFNTESAEDMSEMFEGSTISSLDLSGFDFSKVTDMSRMCTFTEYLESITFPSDMDSSKVTDMSFMFAGDYNLTQINNITAMDTGSVTDMSGMFGAHQCNKKLIETIPAYMDPEIYEGSYQYDKFLDGFAVFSPAWVTAKLYNVNAGPAITSLDLTGFDTRKVKYANGMFYMPNLTGIKWGTNTTFEALSDAGGMFTLASVKKLDLTGRRFSNLKFASSQAFPVEMFNLNKATELVLGEDSLNLSKLSSKGQLMINAPMLYSLDFRHVEMGANALAGKGALYYGSPGSLESLSGLYEIYLPAGMPLLTSPAGLPGTFYDDEGGAYTVISGGYENDLHLVNPEAEGTVEITGISIVNDKNMNTIIAGYTLSLKAVLSPEEATGNVTWSSDKPEVATVDQTGLVTGMAPGKALITVEAGNGVKATFNVTVEAAPVSDEMDVTRVTLNKTSVTLYPGDSFKLSATVSPAGSKDKSITWSSSDTSQTYVKLDVSTGKVTAVRAATDGSGDPVPATVTITATANGAAPGNTVKAECIVTVLPSEIVEKGADDKPITPAAGQAFVTEDDGKGEARIWVAGLDNTGYHYTGNAIKPEIHVYKGYKLLTEKTDYTLSYKNNKNVSKGITEDKKKPQIIIKMKGDYSGSETVYFNIIPMPLENLTADNDVFSTEYKAGKKNMLKPNLMYNGNKVKYGAKDITFKWFTTDEATDKESNCTEPGTYAVKV